MAASSSGGVSQNSLKENCLMHVKDCSKSKFIELTSSSLDRFKKFALEWTKFDCKEAEIARNSATAIGLTLTDSECVGEVSLHPDIGYHYDCYKRFCDISKVKRQAKLAEKRAAETNVNKLDDDADEKEPPRKRALRSDSASGPREWKERHMFPNECIICHSVKTKRNKFTGKRLVVKLMRCEIINGGKLLEAARQKKHVELLQQIEGEDLVARELKYHWECFRDFTRFISKKSKVGLTDSQKRYMPSFEEFSDKTIRKRLLEGKEILTLARLNRIFIRTIKEVEGIDAPYRTWNLKKRLQKAFPQLVFVNPSHRNMSTIVLSERLCAEELAKDLADDYYTSTDSSTEEEQHMEKEQTYSTEGYVRVLFNAALMTKFELEKKSLSIPWPPAAEDLTIQKTKELVPHCLFNFLAWLTGAADEPEDAKFVAVSNENEKKLLSIAQDILFIAKGGKQPLPKHFALATAVRHLTGSAQLVGILNGLGHSIAHSTLLEYNTALAMRQIDLGENALPPEIQPNHFTTIVWDNIDFGEETLSGKGTTHSTNGIMIQRPRQSARITSTPAMKRTRARTLQPPPVEITPFLGCGEKRGPFCIGKDVDVGKNSYKGSEIDGRNLDMAYNLVRSKFSGIPGWTGFNTYLSTKIPQRSVIAYLPVLNASPTEMDTVQTTLTRSLKYADSLGQDVMVLVFDQAIYAKAQQIRWRDETLKQRLVIRLGMFHTKMAYLACIGKRYKDAGLSDILIESGVIALGSINGVMNGHHYNRSMRAHKLMHDALRNLQWEAYIESVPEQERLTINDILTKLKSGFHKKEVSSIVSSNDFQSVVSSFQDFLAKMNKESPTFAFWSSYVNMVENVLLLTRATRTGNWQLHLSIIRRILPWMFAYDRPNYSRYLSAYYLEMCDLQTTHPLAYDALSSGEFAVQRQEGHGFAQVECDICIEQTVNRDAKTKGGLVGFTTNHGAVLRWLLTQHQCSAITNECKAMTAKKGQARIRKDLDQSRIEHDEKDVESIVSIVRNMVNPFDVEGDNLLHLSSGVVASDKVKHDLMQAEEIGVTKFTAFCRNNLQKESTSFYDPIKRCNLATFEAAKKKTMTKVKGKTVTLKADRKLLARLVFIAKVRNIDIQNLMTYCLGPLPLPFATEQGALVKTNKATLMHCVESAAEKTVIVKDIPAGSIWIIDGMAMLQMLHSASAPATFYLLAKSLLQKLVRQAERSGSTELHFVTDTYPEISIKNAERDRRATTGIQVIKIQSNNTNQKRPTQWKKFLSASENKVSFVEYLFHAWQRCPVEAYKGVTIFIAHGKDCHALKADCGVVKADLIPELHCSHEEADTRLLLHAHYAQQNLQSVQSPTDQPAVIIKSMDTDVLIISLGCAQNFTAPLFLHTGRGDKVRTLDIKSLCSQLGMDVASALVGFHPFTGCDSVSGFFGKGKTRPFKLMVKDQQYIQLFQQLGVSFPPSDQLISNLDKFVCHMYGQQKATDVNAARYRMFRLGTFAEESLPPNKDSLIKHIMRANYQAHIFRRCLEQIPEIPSPAGMGWKVEEIDGVKNIQIDWCSLPAAPDDILELTYCSCKKGNCKLKPNSDVQLPAQVTCCSEIGMMCTELCKCSGCQNCHNEDSNISEEEGLDSDDED